MTAKLTVLLILLVTIVKANQELDLDPNGYILYCPCMGRFGNQAEHFLGSFAFARKVNRTLVVPHWHQEPFRSYFQIDPLREYHRVVPMDDFMRDYAPVIWKPEDRYVYCYDKRERYDNKPSEDGGCNAKAGNPFGPFWDQFGVDFVGSRFTKPYLYYSDVAQWNLKFPAQDNFILAFTGAPAAFPVHEANVEVMKYLHWSDKLENSANRYIKQVMGDEEFLAIHFRNGMDWERACEHTRDQDRNLFGSSVCLGFHNEHGKLTKDLCFPSKDIILAQIKATVEKLNVSIIYVAADKDHMIEEIDELFHGEVRVIRNQEASPHDDLVVLTKATHLISNCVSTFSAFAARYRLYHGNLPTTFWAHKFEKDPEFKKIEL